MAKIPPNVFNYLPQIKKNAFLTDTAAWAEENMTGKPDDVRKSIELMIMVLPDTPDQAKLGNTGRLAIRRIISTLNIQSDQNQDIIESLLPYAGSEKVRQSLPRKRSYTPRGASANADQSPKIAMQCREFLVSALKSGDESLIVARVRQNEEYLGKLRRGRRHAPDVAANWCDLLEQAAQAQPALAGSCLQSMAYISCVIDNPAANSAGVVNRMRTLAQETGVEDQEVKKFLDRARNTLTPGKDQKSVRETAADPIRSQSGTYSRSTAAQKTGEPENRGPKEGADASAKPRTRGRPRITITSLPANCHQAMDRLRGAINREDKPAVQVSLKGLACILAVKHNGERKRGRPPGGSLSNFANLLFRAEELAGQEARPGVIKCLAGVLGTIRSPGTRRKFSGMIGGKLQEWSRGDRSVDGLADLLGAFNGSGSRQGAPAGKTSQPATSPTPPASRSTDKSRSLPGAVSSGQVQPPQFRTAPVRRGREATRSPFLTAAAIPASTTGRARSADWRQPVNRESKQAVGIKANWSQHDRVLSEQDIPARLVAIAASLQTQPGSQKSEPWQDTALRGALAEVSGHCRNKTFPELSLPADQSASCVGAMLDLTGRCVSVLEQMLPGAKDTVGSGASAPARFLTKEQALTVNITAKALAGLLGYHPPLVMSVKNRLVSQSFISRLERGEPEVASALLHLSTCPTGLKDLRQKANVFLTHGTRVEKPESRHVDWVRPHEQTPYCA